MRKLSFTELYRFVADDIADAVERCFAPVVALSKEVQKQFREVPGRETLPHDESRTA